MIGLFFVVFAIAVIAYSALVPRAAYSVGVTIQSNTIGTVYPFQTSNLTVKVSNHGSNEVNDMLVVLYLDNNQLHEYTVTIPAGESASIEANYTYQANGTYDFQAIADPAHVLNIANRSNAQSSLDVNVNGAEKPDVYTSLPNNGIDSTQTFSLTGPGLNAIWFINNAYNLSLYSNIFGFGGKAISTTLDDLYGYIKNSNGAYVSYANGTSAYVAWLQGTVTPAPIDALIGSFHFASSSLLDNGTALTIFKMNNQTSLCVYYSYGWTKMIEFNNASTRGNCAGIAARTYAPNESTYFIKFLKNNTVLSNAQGKFQYVNSTLAGHLLKANLSGVEADNIFANTYGLFTTYISKSMQSNKSSSNYTCYGIITDINNTEICSMYIIPSNGSLAGSYSLINSLGMGKNYTLGIYSLVNKTDITAAYGNAAALMNALNISQKYQPWRSAVTNTCSLSNKSLPCVVANFSAYNDSGAINVTDRLGAAIRAQKLSCFIPGAVRTNSTFNDTIAVNGSVRLNVTCDNLAIPLLSAQTSYTLVLNYTIDGNAKIAVGTLNVTNFIT